MTGCRDKCWCKKLPINKVDPDDPPLLQDIFTMSHKIEHLYDGVEKCFERIEKIENSDHDERISSLEEAGIEKRLLKLEAIFHCSSSDHGKKPFVCPRCNDLTDCDMCGSTGLVWG
jgi:hypothetical protein